MPVLPNGPTGSWNLVWNDEFDDTTGMSGPVNGLATGKWNCGWFTGPTSLGVGNITAVTDPVSASQIDYHGPAGIVFPGDGAVHLRLLAGVDNSGTFNTRTVESGFISTAGLMALNPGSIPVSTSSPDLRPYTWNGTVVLEISARFPGTNAQAGAYWPGFWLTNAGNQSAGASWPGGMRYWTEIDFIEFYTFGSLGSLGKFHFHKASEYGGMSSVSSGLQATDLSLAYHTYTYLFSTSTIQLWVDGVAVSGVVPTVDQINAQWRYPQYLLLGMGAVSGAVVPTVGSGTPNDLMVDYVRVWQSTAVTYSSFAVHA